jgi:Protein of unknown function (DUF3892)
MAVMAATKTARIDCINKIDRPNPHERITHVGGTDGGGWKITQEHAIDLIERREWQFYTSVKAKSVWVIVAKNRWGHKYLKTEDDGDDENNLLSLPECP